MTEEKSFAYKMGTKIANGAIAGIVGTSVIFPLDFAKTRLQNQTNLSSITSGPSEKAYKNLFDVLFKVSKATGIRSVYKGLAVNLFFVMPEKAIKLSVNDQLRNAFGSNDGKFLPLWKEVAAGCLAGLCQIIVTTPMEFLKIQMQMNTNKLSANSKSSGGLGLAIGLFRKNGITALYKGASATLCRDVWFSGLYFPSFAYMNSKGFSSDGAKPEFYHTLICGLLAGGFAAFLSTPFDVIKTRLQVRKLNSTDPNYTGIRDCWIKTIKHDGFRALFIGSMIRVAVIAPLFGIAQMVYFLGISQRLLRLID